MKWLLHFASSEAMFPKVGWMRGAGAVGGLEGKHSVLQPVVISQNGSQTLGARQKAGLKFSELYIGFKCESCLQKIHPFEDL